MTGTQAKFARVLNFKYWAGGCLVLVLLYLTGLRSPASESTTCTLVGESLADKTAFVEAVKAVKTRPMKTVSEVLHAVECFDFEKPVGQVGPETPYGKVLLEIAKMDDVQLAVETGTWDGAGSSLALAKGFDDSQGMLFTIEAVEEMWIRAQHILLPYPVKCLLGVGVDSSDFPTVDDVRAAGGVGHLDEEQWRAIHAAEKALVEAYPVGLIRPICRRYTVDLFHIDGGEMAGTSEFKMVMQHCAHLKFIALDDTQLFKNRQNYLIMKKNPAWEIFKEDQVDRHGWAVFKRRN